MWQKQAKEKDSPGLYFKTGSFHVPNKPGRLT